MKGIHGGDAARPILKRKGPVGKSGVPKRGNCFRKFKKGGIHRADKKEKKPTSSRKG